MFRFALATNVMISFGLVMPKKGTLTYLPRQYSLARCVIIAYDAPNMRRSPLYILAFILCLQGLAISPSCLDRLRSEAQPNIKTTDSFQDDIKHFFRFQENGPYLARGLLVEFVDGEKILSIGEYMGTLHQVMIKEVEAKNEFKTIEKTLWVGELEFEKLKDGSFIVKRANQTSGMWFDAVSGKAQLTTRNPVPNINNVGSELINFLEAAKLPMTNDFEVVPFHDDFKHLLLALKVPQNDSLLHFLNNVLNDLALPLTMVVELEGIDVDPFISAASKRVDSIIIPVLEHIYKMYAKRVTPEFLTEIEFAQSVLEDLSAANKSLEQNQPVAREILSRLADRERNSRFSSFISKVSLSTFNIELATLIPRLDESEDIPDRTIPQIFHFSLDPK